MHITRSGDRYSKYIERTGNAGCIRQHIRPEACKTLAHAFITYRLDSANVVLYYLQLRCWNEASVLILAYAYKVLAWQHLVLRGTCFWRMITGVLVRLQQLCWTIFRSASGSVKHSMPSRRMWRQTFSFYVKRLPVIFQILYRALYKFHILVLLNVTLYESDHSYATTTNFACFLALGIQFTVH